jgi:type II secretory pathway predicted ATPase ExeA
MSAYLKYFELVQSPFEGKAQSKVVLGTRALRDALKAIRGGLEEGSARICVSGGPGLGKTSLARSLPKLLGETARVALVRDPSLPWESLRAQIAKQWGLESRGLARNRLLTANCEHRLVLVVDRAEQASEEFLDHLDIMLSIRSEIDEPVVQSVLFACLAGLGSGDSAPIVWWLDRIQTLDLEFAPIPRDGVESYIHKHLKRAGWRGEPLFSSEAALAIAGVTGGVPGEISSLCERLLAEAAERGQSLIDADFIHDWIDEANRDNDPELADEFSEEEESSEEQVVADDATVPAETPVVLELVHLATDDVAGVTLADESDPYVGETNRHHASDSLARTLEHFERAEADDSEFSPDSCDEPESEVGNDSVEEITEANSLAALEDYLGAPVSHEELRAIRRGRLHPQLRAIAAVLVAALIGAIAFAWPGEDLERDVLAGSEKFDRPQLSMLEATKPLTPRAPIQTLARIRGPVDSVDTPAGVPFAAKPLANRRSKSPASPAAASVADPAVFVMSPNAATTEAGTAQHGASDQDDLLASHRNENDSIGDFDGDSDGERGGEGDGELSADEFEDMRPASMRRDSAANFDLESRF